MNKRINSKDLSVWYYGCVCHNCGTECCESLLTNYALTDYDEYEPENLILVCEHCKNSIDIMRCLRTRNELGNHKMVLAFREFYVKYRLSLEGSIYDPDYEYIFDLMEALRGHGEYIDSVDIHAPYRQERPSDMVVLDYELFMKLARTIYDDLIERGELREGR